MGPTRAHLGAPTRAIKGGEEGAPQNQQNLAAPSVGAPLPLSAAPPPAHQTIVRSCGSSNPESEASSRTCGLRGGVALAAQGRAIREEVHATALPASIFTTLTRYRSSATTRLVVPQPAVILVYVVENFCFCYPIFLQRYQEPVLPRYRSGYVHMEICIVLDRSMT